MKTIDFMKSVREEFGEYHFRAYADTVVLESKGCPRNPKHPFNRPDSEYVIPVIIPKAEEEK